MHRIVLTTLTLAMMSATAVAAAEGLYLGVSLGTAFYDDQDLPGSRSVELEDGGDGSLYIGYDFGPQSLGVGLRAELQFSAQCADAEGDVDGQFQTGATFLNVLVDFDPTGEAKWVPYVGVGVGHAQMKFKDYTTAAGGLQDDSDAVLGGQAIVGVAYRMTDHVRFSADLRHSGWEDADITDGAGAKHEVANQITTINLGFTYAF